MSTQDTKRVQRYIANQKLFARAINKQKGLLPPDGGIQPLDSTVENGVVNKVQLFTDTRNVDRIVEDEFSAIMLQYVGDQKVIDKLFREIGEPAAQEFVLNYDSYKPKLKRIEGKRLNKDTLIAFFKDILSENLVKKGLLVPNVPNNMIKSIAGVKSAAPSVDVLEMQQKQYQNPHMDVVPAQYSKPLSPPVFGQNKSAFTNNNAAPKKADDGEEEVEVPLRPVKKKLGGPANQAPQISEQEYKRVWADALDKFAKFVDNRCNVQTVQKILTELMGVKGTTKLKKAEKIVEMIKQMISNHSEGDYHDNEYILEWTGALENKDDDYNEWQVLYISEAQWIADRSNRKYEGFGVKPAIGHHTIVGRYYVDRRKLGKGILDIRYNKNKHLTNIKPQMVSPELKQVIDQLLDNKALDKSAYHKLNPHEQNLVRNLNRMFDVNEDIEDDDSFDERFNIVIGEIRAGNTSAALKQEAKQYILYAMRINKIPRNVGYDLLMEID
jgi:hypothetical protein